MADTFSDRIRKLYSVHSAKFTTYGVATHDVTRRIKTWSTSRRRGTASNVDTVLSPRPHVQILRATDVLSSGGVYRQGDLRLKIPLESTVNGVTRGYTIADFTPPNEVNKELMLVINGKEWKIIDGPSTYEGILYMVLVVREMR